jgi:hypothetical protein
VRVARTEVATLIHITTFNFGKYGLAGKQKYVRTPGCNEKRYLAGALNPKTGKLTWVEGGPEEQPLVPGTPLQTRDGDVSERLSRPHHS